MAQDAQTLLTEGQCYDCYGGSEYTLALMNTALLRQVVLALNPMADTSPQTLLTQGQCYQCYGSNIYTLMLMQLALLAQIAGGSGVATGGSVGVVDPEGVVTANAGSIYWNTANQTLWVKQSGSGNTGWSQLI